MSVVYDAGVLVAAERNDRATWAAHRARLELGWVPRTTAPVVAQVSRSVRQVQLRRFLRSCLVDPFSSEQAPAVGELAGKARSNDVVDAHVVLLASTHSATVLTSDPKDLQRLSDHLRTPVSIETV